MRKVLLVLSFTLFGLGAVHLYAQSCNTTTMYGLTGGGLIYPITMANANVGAAITPAAANGTQNANALGYNPTNGKYYFWASTTYNYSIKCTGPKNSKVCDTTISIPKFVSFNPSTGTYDTLSIVNGPCGPDGTTSTTIRTGCVSQDGSGYYCLDVNGTLWYYSILAGTWTTISSVWKDQLGTDISGIVALQTSGDMSIDGNGNLWMLIAGTTSYGLYELSAPLPTFTQPSLTLKQHIPYNTPNPDKSTIAGIAFSALGEIYISSLSDSLYIMDYNLKPTYVNKFTTTNVGNDLTSCQFPMTVLQPVTVLPVRFESFEGKLLQDKTVQLSWEARIDEKHQYFEVEHSVDGVHFNSLGKSSSISTYRDVAPNSGNNIYRIKQVDKEGRTTYSKAININLEIHMEALVYPNPARDIMNIKLRSGSPDAVTIKIADLQGREIYRHHAAILSGHDLKVDISSWKPQFYVVTFYNSNNEVVSTQKIVKY